MGAAAATSTVRANIRDWVEQLKPGSYFHLTSVPGTAREKQVALSRMVRQPNSRLKRVGRGCYQWARLQDRDGSWIGEINRTLIARVHLYGRPGSGWGGATAQNKIGWAQQVTIKDFVAVLVDEHGNVPRSPVPGLVYQSRYNRRRSVLRWPEVSVLEALREYRVLGLRGIADQPEWERAMRSFTSGFSWERYGSQIDLERLRWAAATEPARHRNAIIRGLPEVAKAVQQKRAEQPEVLAAQPA